MPHKLLITALLLIFATGCNLLPEDEEEVQCTAAPTCASDEEQVDACEDDADTCREVTVCGATIYCAASNDQCDGLPSCPSGSEELPQCVPNPAGGICADCAEGDCFETTMCGQTITCKTCEEAPACPPNRVTVDSCASEDEDTCVTIPHCGMSFGCKLV